MFVERMGLRHLYIYIQKTHSFLYQTRQHKSVLNSSSVILERFYIVERICRVLLESDKFGHDFFPPIFTLRYAGGTCEDKKVKKRKKEGDNCVVEWLNWSMEQKLK